MEQSKVEQSKLKLEQWKKDYLNFNLKAIETFLGIEFKGTTYEDKKAFVEEHHEERVRVTTKMMDEMHDEFVREQQE